MEMGPNYCFALLISSAAVSYRTLRAVISIRELYALFRKLYVAMAPVRMSMHPMLLYIVVLTKMCLFGIEHSLLALTALLCISFSCMLLS
jgi:hypothetical protein